MSFQNCKIRGIGVNPISYHGDKPFERGNPAYVISPSTLREIGHCPARWLAGYEPPPSEAKEWGSLLDCLVLTPGDFDARYAVRPLTFPDAKGQPSTSGNTTACKAWVAEQEEAGREIVKADDLAEVKKAIAKIHADDILHRFLQASDKQVWVVGEWLDEKTGLVIPCQCLIDLVPRKDSEFAQSAGDLKSTRSAAPFVFESFSRQRGYHVQAAFDLDILNAATGEERDTWCFVLSENYPPYQTGRMICELVKVNIGRQLYRLHLGRYAQCLKTGVWPDYQAGPGTIQGWSIDHASKLDEMELVRVTEGASFSAEDGTESVPDDEGEVLP
jgi:hypothetical protein